MLGLGGLPRPANGCSSGGGQQSMIRMISSGTYMDILWCKATRTRDDVITGHCRSSLKSHNRFTLNLKLESLPEPRR